MSVVTSAVPLLARPLPATELGPLATLAQRRLQLTARRPRELLVPLTMPILFALVIAPALRQALHTGSRYESLVAVGSIGLLIPVNAMFSGISVIVDREHGAQRELLAAPIARSLLLLGNLVVALALATLQVGAVTAAALARGIHFHAGPTGIAWFVSAASLLAAGMYGVAEILAARAPTQEEYVARIPAVAIVPWFLAGSLFPITAMPSFLTWITRFLPLTHALALMRYGLLGDSGGLHNIWQLQSATGMAALSLAIVAVFAFAVTAAAIRVFTRSALG
jgi:ABC-2 type transport system permease protein